MPSAKTIDNKLTLYVAPIVCTVLGALIVACISAALTTWLTSQANAKEIIVVKEQEQFSAKRLSDIDKSMAIMQVSLLQLDEGRRESQHIIAENTRVLTLVDKTLSVVNADLTNLKDRTKSIQEDIKAINKARR